jgi:hypothetical protein
MIGLCKFMPFRFSVSLNSSCTDCSPPVLTPSAFSFIQVFGQVACARCALLPVEIFFLFLALISDFFGDLLIRA